MKSHNMPPSAINLLWVRFAGKHKATLLEFVIAVCGRRLTTHFQQLRHYSHTSLASIAKWFDYLQRLRIILKGTQYISTNKYEEASF